MSDFPIVNFLTSLRSSSASQRPLLSFPEEVGYRGRVTVTAVGPRPYCRPATTTPPHPPCHHHTTTFTLPPPFDRDARRLGTGQRSAPRFHHTTTFRQQARRPPAAKPPSVPACIRWLSHFYFLCRVPFSSGEPTGLRAPSIPTATSTTTARALRLLRSPFCPCSCHLLFTRCVPSLLCDVHVQG